jgi:hypothetical protein
MTIFQRFGNFLRGLNTHFVANFGALCMSAAGATQLPPVQSGLDLFHDGGKTKNTVNASGVALAAIGSALLYLGRPKTIAADPVPPNPAGNHAP